MCCVQHVFPKYLGGLGHLLQIMRPDFMHFYRPLLFDITQSRVQFCTKSPSLGETRTVQQVNHRTVFEWELQTWTATQIRVNLIALQALG